MTQINLRIDEEIKANAEVALKEMGLSMSTAITMFLVKVGREKRIPFEISVDPFYDEEHIAELVRRIESVRKGLSQLQEHELIEDD
ncbi:MAG: type II toxin-antitoxin system RelB/DinJ family antitoxin [Clostridiales bacterium]|nr:type II toxin-antitoxin system RelB/DinJ family antitoxin [Clostridiales bacterium]